MNKVQNNQNGPIKGERRVIFQLKSIDFPHLGRWTNHPGRSTFQLETSFDSFFRSFSFTSRVPSTTWTNEQHRCLIDGDQNLKGVLLFQILWVSINKLLSG
ncbi:hypothetical protein RND81_11G095100 [Saponaria officinalis]|uniref:Uncharacterized protein n=1 Tax=Saponaria officinalis TaxID=3572 RepID=A0AAW1HL30_SAPOF